MICNNICKYTAQNDQKKQEHGKYRFPLQLFLKCFFSFFRFMLLPPGANYLKKAQLLKASGQLPYPHLRILHSWIDLFIDSLCNKAA